MASFVISDARIFTGDDVIEVGHVVVEKGVIQSIGSGQTDAAPSLPVVSARGCTLLPGLIDAHIHAHDCRVSAMERALRFGVTTIMDMHNERESFMELKKIAASRTSTLR